MSDRRLVSVLLGIAFGAAAYALCETLRVPMCWYDFMHRRWGFGFQPPATMAFYGRSLWAIAAFGLGWLLGRATLLSQRPRLIFALMLAVLVGASITSVAHTLGEPSRPLPLPTRAI